MKKSELLRLGLSAAMVGALLAGDRNVTVATAAEKSSDRIGLSGEVGASEEKLGIETYVPKLGDVVKFGVRRADNFLNTADCRTSPASNGWTQCLEFFGESGRTMNGREITYTWELGLQSDGSFVEAWIVSEDGTTVKVDITKVRELTPADAAGVAIIRDLDEQISIYQPSEPVGSIVVLEMNNGTQLMCRYKPDVGPFIMVMDVMGRWISSKNWEEGLYFGLSMNTGTNCNRPVDSKEGDGFKSVTVNGQNYQPPLVQKLNPVSLVGVSRKMNTVNRRIPRQTGKR